jgi:hypothetical protein
MHAHTHNCAICVADNYLGLSLAAADPTSEAHFVSCTIQCSSSDITVLIHDARTHIQALTGDTRTMANKQCRLASVLAIGGRQFAADIA